MHASTYHATPSAEVRGTTRAEHAYYTKHASRTSTSPYALRDLSVWHSHSVAISRCGTPTRASRTSLRPELNAQQDWPVVPHTATVSNSARPLPGGFSTDCCPRGGGSTTYHMYMFRPPPRHHCCAISSSLSHTFSSASCCTLAARIVGESVADTVGLGGAPKSEW